MSKSSSDIIYRNEFLTSYHGFIRCVFSPPSIEGTSLPQRTRFPGSPNSIHCHNTKTGSKKTIASQSVSNS